MSEQNKNYIYATERPWSLNAFAAQRKMLSGNWQVVTQPDDLVAAINNSNPRYVFFPHWSHFVPREIFENVECVCFHMTDLPFGRGGSPLQNLISRGHENTVLTALRMIETFDAGPIYLKQPLSLEGSATDIFERMSDLAMQMIAKITLEEPNPLDQSNENSIEFKRRNPAMSELPSDGDLKEIYDHIRMLDAPGYPNAFVKNGKLELKFTQAEYCTGDQKQKVFARVEITQSENDK